MRSATRVARTGVSGRRAAAATRSFLSSSQRVRDRVPSAGAGQGPQIGAWRRILRQALRVHDLHVRVGGVRQARLKLAPEVPAARVRWRLGNDEQVARPRAGHVEQAPRLGPRLALLALDEGVPVRGLAALAEADGQRALLPQRDVHAGAGVVGGVEERHDRGLEALGLVHGEDAHGVRIARPRGGQVGLLARARDALLPGGA